MRKTKERIISGIMCFILIMSNTFLISTPVIQANGEIESTELTSENINETLSEEISSSEIISSETEISSEISLSENTSTEIISDEYAINSISEEISDETLTDNWELELVFYDSAVDNGNTPLTYIDWDASDGGYSDEYTRTIRMQIKYRNTQAVTTYEVGTLKITVPNLIYLAHNHLLETSWDVAANNSSSSGRQWTLVSDSANYAVKDLVFTNNIVLEEKSNFEGTIQIFYTITSVGESTNTGNGIRSAIENYEDECTHSLYKEEVAVLEDFNGNELAKSKSAVFDYTRTYIHPWKKNTYTITETASKLSSYDGMGSDAEKYYWVAYNIKDTTLRYNRPIGYPYINLSKKTYPNHYYYIDIPDDCVVYDSNFNLLNVDNESGMYKLKIVTYRPVDMQTGTISIDGSHGKIFVGYPRETYNEANGNLIINNPIDMYGVYDNNTEYEYLASTDISINLTEYEFEYDGELYGITKSNQRSSSTMYSDLMKRNDSPTSFNRNIYDASITAIYTGNPMTVEWGDDLLYITDSNNKYRKLEDSEYEFYTIYCNNIQNMNGVAIDINKYDINLYVRYANKQEYELYCGMDAFTYSNKLYSLNVDGKNIVGFYFKIEDATESIIIPSGYFSTVRFHTSNNIADTGTFYNFNYLKVYFKDQDGNLILQNECAENNYSTIATKLDVGTNDLKVHGCYIQRGYVSKTYEDWNPNDFESTTGVKKTLKGSIKQDVANELWSGKFNLTSYFGGYYVTDSQYRSALHKDLYVYYWDVLELDRLLISEYVIYDLLPEGMVLESTEEEIIDSFILVNMHYNCTYKSDKSQFASREELFAFLKENISVTITENWQNTGRTKLEFVLDLKEEPIIVFSHTGYLLEAFTITYDWSISYDTYMEYGSSYTNSAYSMAINRAGENTNDLYCKRYPYYSTKTYVADSLDFNKNSNETEKLYKSSASISLVNIVSTHQDVQIQVQSDLSNYSTGTVEVSPEQEYSYKLRVRTGTNQVTNLVLINNIEEAYGSNTNYWQGEFLGIDTSFAENRIYNVYDPDNENADENGYVNVKLKVKAYYSTNKNEGNLYETELITVTDDDGNIIYNVDGTELKMEVRVTDPEGKFVKNTNWLEYNDTVDKSTVKSLAFEFLNSETGKPAIFPSNSLVYIEVLMKAPTEDKGLNGNKLLYAYNSCFTQWNAIDEFSQTVDFITGINSNIVKVHFPYSLEEITVLKVWEFSEDYLKFNLRNTLGYQAPYEKIEILNIEGTSILETIEYNGQTGLIVSANKYTINASYQAKVYIADGTVKTVNINENKFEIVPVEIEIFANDVSQGQFELNSGNNWTTTIAVSPDSVITVKEITTGDWIYDYNIDSKTIINTVNQEIEIADIEVPAPLEVPDTGNEKLPASFPIMLIIGITGIMVSYKKKKE